MAGAGVWALASPALANTNAIPTSAASALFTVTPPGLCVAGGTWVWAPSGPSLHPFKILEPFANARDRGGPPFTPGRGAGEKKQKFPPPWRNKTLFYRPALAFHTFSPA